MERIDILDAIRAAGRELGEPLSRKKFLSYSGMTEYQILKHFPSWSAALKAAGVQVDETNIRLNDEELLRDWGEMVRRDHEIPTRNHYRREGNFGVNSFVSHFGPWSTIPEHFRRFAIGNPEWSDVVELLPLPRNKVLKKDSIPSEVADKESTQTPSEVSQHSKITGRQMYGNPIDFRGLRHEPINENGVINCLKIVLT